jgi:hypothetical protein
MEDASPDDGDSPGSSTLSTPSVLRRGSTAILRSNDGSTVFMRPPSARASVAPSHAASDDENDDLWSNEHPSSQLSTPSRVRRGSAPTLSTSTHPPEFDVEMDGGPSPGTPSRRRGSAPSLLMPTFDEVLNASSAGSPPVPVPSRRRGSHPNMRLSRIISSEVYETSVYEGSMREHETWSDENEVRKTPLTNEVLCEAA